MAINDYVETTTTTATDFNFPSVRQQQLDAMKRQLEALESQRRVAANTPFDETDDFRDYVVWLCGYTQRKSPPDQEEWDELRQETKKVAAKFALQTRTRRAMNVGTGYRALSGLGISGDAILQGNEEALT